MAAHPHSIRCPNCKRNYHRTFATCPSCGAMNPFKPGDDPLTNIFRSQPPDGITGRLSRPDKYSPGGKKHDSGKTRMELLPHDALEAVALVLTDGAAKYDARNWEKGIAYSRLYGAMQRHLSAWWRGEENDPDSGRPHLWHAACEAMMLVAETRRGVGEDDRPAGEAGSMDY